MAGAQHEHASSGRMRLASDCSYFDGERVRQAVGD
jgi:hypothetical protein